MDEKDLNAATQEENEKTAEGRRGDQPDPIQADTMDKHADEAPAEQADKEPPEEGTDAAFEPEIAEASGQSEAETEAQYEAAEESPAIEPEVSAIETEPDVPENTIETDLTVIAGQDGPETVFEVPQTGKKRKKKDPNQPKKGFWRGQSGKGKARNIAILATILVLVLAASIAIPIALVNKDKIFVKTQEDFLKTDKGNLFVLKKDVRVDGDLVLNTAYPIDLGKYKLHVTGDLTVRSEEADTSFYIGTKKKGEWVAKGSLVVEGAFDVVLPNAGVHFKGPVEAGELKVHADSVMIENGLTVRGRLVLDARNASILQGASFVGTTAEAEIRNAAFNLFGEADAAFQLVGSAMTLRHDGAVQSVKLDEYSSLHTFGKITGFVAGADEDGAQVMGKEVYFDRGSYCPLVENITLVKIFAAESRVDAFYNCTTLMQMEKLNVPTNLTVTDEDGVVKLIVSKVHNALYYEVTIFDGTRTEVLTEGLPGQPEVFDISAYVLNPAKYTLSVRAMGPENGRFIASDTIYYDYNHQVQLKTPAGISVTQEGELFFVSFARISLADEYRVEVNGREKTFKRTGNSTERFEITDLIQGIGEYSVLVTAKSYNTGSFKDSNTGAASIIVTGKLAAPEPTLEIVEGQVRLRFEPVDGALLYTVYIVRPNGVPAVYCVTAGNTLTIDIDALEDGTAFYIIAEGSGLYQTSEKSETVIFVKEA